MKNQLTKTPYLVLFIVLITIGVGTASALITITLSGDVIITGFLDMTGDKITNVDTPTLPTDAATKAYVDSAPGTDTLALLGCTDSQIAQFVGSAWTCVADPAIATDLNCVGCVSATDLATGSVTTDEIADGTITFSDIKGVDGTPQTGVWNSRIPSSNTLTPLDETGNVGLDTSITIGTDGLPIISYGDITSLDLKVVHCTNATCSTFDTPTPLDEAGSVGEFTSITIGTDGLPIISYHDITKGDLKVVHCKNVSCTGGVGVGFDTPTPLDETGNVGLFTSITIGTDGLPIISYFDFTKDDLKAVHCTNVSCSTFDTPITLDETGNVGEFTSITIGTDGLPIISYWDSGFGKDDLKVVHCGDADCAGNTNANTITTVDSTGDVGTYTSITIGTDGLPIISYRDGTSLDLKVVHCTNVLCSAFDTPTPLDETGSVGLFTSITIGTDGLPIISYYDNIKDDLKAVHCTNVSCSTFDTPITLDATGNVGEFTSITIGTDGLPIISYQDGTNGDLKVAKCGSNICIPNWTRR